jgi:hypothetical protein
MPDKISDTSVRQFVRDGYIKIDNAFSAELANEASLILWRDAGCDPHNPGTWKKPVIRLGDYSQDCFTKAANADILLEAFDRLIGKGNWLPRMSLGGFVIRFPNSDPPDDIGWHVDASIPSENPNDFFSWRINITSTGRALLMLFLFSDVSQTEAPTRIRVGSHLDVAQLLSAKGEEGLSFMELAEKLDITSARAEVFATGKVGTVYLCHPFLVHAGQAHHGRRPRILAQPPLCPSKEFKLQRSDDQYCPVEKAIRIGIGLESIED